MFPCLFLVPYDHGYCVTLRVPLSPIGRGDVLEDLNKIDIVTHEPGKWVTFVIIDSGVTKRDNPDLHLSLLNHKIDVCLAHLEDEQRFAEFGKPAEVVIEVRCAYPVASPTPIPRSVIYPSGRAMDYCIKFVDRTK